MGEGCEIPSPFKENKKMNDENIAKKLGYARISPYNKIHIDTVKQSLYDLEEAKKQHKEGLVERIEDSLSKLGWR